MNDFLQGDYDLLYLLIDAEYIPIGCLETHSFSESSDTIDTTTIDNAGWKTSIPTNQSYSITFDGLSVISNEATITKYSYDLLVALKRNRTLISWKEIYDREGKYREQTGQGYIIEISEQSPAGELIGFSATIEGYGAPVLVSYGTDEVDRRITENGDTRITETSDNRVLAQ